MTGSATYEFTLLVEGADRQNDPAQDALFEAGCDDATIGVAAGVQHMDFARAANSFAEAVLSAVAAVESAVPGLRVTRVMPDDYVTLAEIGARTGRTRGEHPHVGQRCAGPRWLPAASGPSRRAKPAVAMD